MRASALLVAVVLVCGRAAAETPPPAAPRTQAVFWSVPEAPPGAVAEAKAALDAIATGVERLDLSPPATRSSRAAEKLQAAVALYGRMHFDEARAALDEAVTEAMATGGRGLTQTELADIYLYRGLALQARGETSRCWDDFVRAAIVAPGRLLDPARFPPRAVTTMRRASEEVAAAPRGTLVVVAPPGARVFVDAADAGPAPAQVAALPFGQHLVRVEHPEYETWAGVAHLATVSQRLEPPLRRLAPPDDALLARLARERGATHAVLVAVWRHADGVRLEIRAVDRSGARILAETAALSDIGPALGRATAATKARMGPPTRDGSPAPAPPPPWYKRVWVWATVAAVVVTVAVAVPLAIMDRDPATSFGTRLDLGAWRR